MITMPNSSLELFVVFYVLSCLIKFLLWFPFGGWSRFDPGTFEASRLASRFASPLAGLLVRGYQPALLARALGIFISLVLNSLLTAVFIAVLGLVVELAYEWRRNTVFLAMIGAILGLLGGGSFPGLLPEGSINGVVVTADLAIILLVFHVYLNSAWLKYRSPQYWSGRLLAQHVYFRSWVQKKSRHRVFFVPSSGNGLVGLDDSVVSRWRFLSRFAVCIELILPFLLAFSQTYVLGLVVGIALHAAFVALSPFRIIAFTLVTVSTYLFFPFW